MLKEKVSKFYRENLTLNCAESMIYGANEEYGLELDQSTLDTMASFGGGMCVGGACGALTGALAVIGVMITKDKSMDKEERKAIAVEFYTKFQEKLGTDNCKEIKEKYWDEELRCQRVVEMSADVLEEIIRKYR
ncbi:MAG TPA: C-GCAxxG-C-C family (seleno)protein [Thermotogota bacterium]|nr:C-GCAxxG-C-C family (seleno)protein [Thermotogota bacterium]HPJ89989.1 C-GCAxxG-C-C family (seleno)protein [Thermotogota bacterium]HPR97206.1 C-GCAxxG-C-C family (seleno)protein [Thermotogota bacterium]